MADLTKIEWCDRTFNPWRGCVKVSPGCDNCYAETLSKRNPAALGEWGKDANRVIAAEAYWRKPERWERGAAAFEAEHGRRQRVFCASLGDVFENRPDLLAPRLRLLDLIRRTPSLDWLLLTKRPKNVVPLLRLAWDQETERRRTGEGYQADTVFMLAHWIDGGAPPNVWLGTSVEDQERADQRVPALLKVPAAVRFLSCEPLLGPVRLEKWLQPLDPYCDFCPVPSGIHWVIAGGESGASPRPMHPDWARSLRDQCAEAGVPFLFKQWGAWAPSTPADGATHGVNVNSGRCIPGAEKANPEHFPHWQFVRRDGKKAAGRQIDGRTHDGFPASEVAAR